MIKVISKVALVITILAILYMLISQNLFSALPLVIAGQLVAVGLSVWAHRSFQKGRFNIHAEPLTETLLETGPYQFIRHPMYAAALLLIWSSILGHINLLNIVIGLAVTGTIAVRVFEEEKFLQIQFAGYAEYSKKTKRIIPYLV
jgi:protein-S-isoprenylcysteine O-methyltransferase Ste14